MPTWAYLLVGLASPVVVAIAGAMAIRWRYHADSRSNLAKVFRDEVMAAANLATEFWLLDLTSLPAGTSDPDQLARTKDRLNASSLSARLQGAQERVDLALDILRPHLRSLDTLGMDKPMAAFSASLTGGSFDDPLRGADLERALGTQIAAATLVRDVMNAVMRRDHSWWHTAEKKI